MFQNTRRGRQARNFTTNLPKILDLKSSSEQIFPKIDVGCPWLLVKAHLRPYVLSLVSHKDPKLDLYYLRHTFHLLKMSYKIITSTAFSTLTSLVKFMFLLTLTKWWCSQYPSAKCFFETLIAKVYRNSKKIKPQYLTVWASIRKSLLRRRTRRLQTLCDKRDNNFPVTREPTANAPMFGGLVGGTNPRPICLPSTGS